MDAQSCTLGHFNALAFKVQSTVCRVQSTDEHTECFESDGKTFFHSPNTVILSASEREGSPFKLAFRKVMVGVDSSRSDALRMTELVERYTICPRILLRKAYYLYSALCTLNSKTIVY